MTSLDWARLGELTPTGAAEQNGRMDSGPASQRPDSEILSAVRRWILVILLLGLIGTGTELLLMRHFEDSWQLVPAVLIAASLPALIGAAVVRRRAFVRILQFVMVLFILSGAIGIVLHCRGKLEFKREVDPALRGMALFWEAMKGIMPPALAPGSMIQMGLLGLAYAYRHPATSRVKG